MRWMQAIGWRCLYQNMLLKRFKSSTSFNTPIATQVLVELQFSFLCFLVAQNYDSFEQWKHLVAMLCTCVKAMTKFPSLFISFMADLHFQVLFSIYFLVELYCTSDDFNIVSHGDSAREVECKFMEH